MGKKKVHEIAKDLGIRSKDITTYLESKGITKTPSSGLEENELKMVTEHFGADKDNNEEKKAAKTEAAETESAEKAAPKKKHVTFLINHENMSSNRGNKGKKNDGRRSSDNRGEKKNTSGEKKNGSGKGENAPRRDKNDRGERRSKNPNKNNAQNAGRPLIKPRGLVSERTLRPSPAELAEQRRLKAEAEAAEAAAAAKAAEEAAAAKAAEEAAAKKAEEEASGVRQIGGLKILGRVDVNKKSAPAEKSSKNERNNRGSRNERNGEGRNNRSDRNNGNNGNNERNNRRNNDNRDNSRGGKNNDRDNRNNRSAANEAAASAVDRSAKTGAQQRNDHKKNTNSRPGRSDRRQENFKSLEKTTAKKHNKNQNKAPERKPDEILTIKVPEHLTIQELAEKMLVQPSEVIKKLFLQGKMVTMNTEVDYESAEEIALEFNCVCEPEEKVDEIAELLKEEEEDPDTLIPRPPVVCVMGHVDHGKTSLLDAIRDAHVTRGEAGGITQAIGAYTVKINDQKITFLDTPGHEAFTAMRMRGASSTDIAVLVVAADDGVMPQTVEAINHAKAAGVEIIVAINKIDKPGANIDRVKQELSEYELIPEDWGGSTPMVPVSAHTKEGIDELLEMILLTAEIMELRANPNRNARGLIIEAKLDKGRGVVATALVQKGTLHVGDYVAAGASYGRVRAMSDDKLKRVKAAGPSMPVEILGLSEVPNAGEIFNAVDSDKEAKAYAATFVNENKNRLLDETRARTNLNNLFDQIKAGNMKELDIIVKADVQGSVEAVRQSLEKLSNDEVVVKVIHGGVGAINESDVILASASNAIIIGFNVRPDAVAKDTADREGVDLRLYKVIYSAIEDVESAMKGMLEPIYEEKVIGHAQVRQIFKASGVGNIAGSYILDGFFERGCSVRISRDGDQIFEGKLGSLKRFKDDVKEVKAGYECGLVFDGFNEFAVDDLIEAYKMVEVPR